MYEKKDVESAITYLTAAKEILEVNKLENSDTYTNILASLEELGLDQSAVEELEEIDEDIKEDTTE